MAKLLRKTQKVFGANGANDEFAVFGTMKNIANNQNPIYSKDVETLQSNIAYSEGWQQAVISGFAPFLEELNAICYSLTYQMSYILQNGIAEWDDGTVYYTNSIVIGSNSELYRCLVDDCINVNPVTDDGTNWYNYSLYGANQDLSNLTTLGNNRLHALKSYLDNGTLLTDTTLYNDVSSYAHSTFDLSKFTIVGSPNISENGIASGLSGSNYVECDCINTDGTIYIPVPNTSSDYAGESVTGCYKIYKAANWTNRLDVMINNGNTRIIDLHTAYNLVSDKMIIKIEKQGYNYSVSYKINDDDWVSETPVTLSVEPTGTKIKFQGGSVDLKQYKVYNVYGIPEFSSNKTGLDTIKVDDYTVNGTLSISDDGVASGFSSSNYIGIDKSITLGDDFEIYLDILTGADMSSNQSPFRFVSGSSFRGAVTYDATNKDFRVNFSDGTNNDSYSGTLKLSENKRYKFRWKVFNGNLFYYYQTDTDTDWQLNGSITTNLNITDALTLITLGKNNAIIWNGAIDLNAFKIYVKGELVYQACLKIPYSESSTGSKVVDVAYRDRVQDVYEQFGSALYYTIDEINKNVTLPFGEVYGFIEENKKNIRGNSNAIETKQTIGDWCNTIPTTTSTATQNKPAVVVENYSTNKYGYRVWSDGAIEQWGAVSTTGTSGVVTINLMKSYPNEYNISLTTGQAGGSGPGHLSFDAAGATSFLVMWNDLSSPQIEWRTIGY